MDVTKLYIIVILERFIISYLVYRITTQKRINNIFLLQIDGLLKIVRDIHDKEKSKRSFK